MPTSPRNTPVSASCWLPKLMRRNIAAQRREKIAAYFLIGFVVAAGTVFAFNRVNAAPAPQLPTPGHLEPAKSIPLTIEVKGSETYAEAEARTKREIRALRENRKVDHIADVGKKVANADHVLGVTKMIVRPAVPARTSSELLPRAAAVCAKVGLATDPCARDLVAMAWKESRFNQNAIGDGGKSASWFQIQTKMHKVSMACAKDFDCAAEWTINRMKSKGYPEYRSFAIEKHNGAGPAARKYAESVKAYSISLK